MNHIQEEKAWHAVYIRSRAEKKAYAELTSINIESFLPLQKQLRQWKDRKKWVEVPLVTGYCFVSITRRDFDAVLQFRNVISFVYFDHRPAIIPDREIDYLKQMLRQTDFEINVSVNNFCPGEKVEIIQSPLMGIQGELVKAHGKQRFILRLNCINTVFIADVPAEYLTALPPVLV